MTETETTHHRICPLCEACCGLEIKVDAGKVISIRGHAQDVFSAGYICPKGVALKDLHEDPDRLRTPLIKRNGVHEPATWDEAFAEIERRLPPLLAAHGRDASAVVVGNPSAHKIGLLTYFGKLARALGTRNVFSASTLDQMPKQLASGLMFGHWLSVALPDIARTDLLLVIGANPMASNGSMWTVPDFKGKAKALQARGGQLIVIDPRRTETAALADTHHFIRPGADVFLLAAMVHTLFEEDRVTLGTAGEWVVGVDEVRQAVAPFTPELAAARCGMAADTIRALARQLASTPRAAVYARIGTCTQEYGTLASWLVDVLNTLTGHLDLPGGVLFAKSAAFASNTAGKPGMGKGVTTGRHQARVSGAPEVYGELPITCLAEEIETPGEGQVRALFTVATNPVLSSPQRTTTGSGAGHAGLHGQHGHLFERDHPPRRRDLARPVALGGVSLRRGVSPAVLAQPRALQPAGAHAARQPARRMENPAQTGRHCQRPRRAARRQRAGRCPVCRRCRAPVRQTRRRRDAGDPRSERTAAHTGSRAAKRAVWRRLWPAP